MKKSSDYHKVVIASGRAGHVMGRDTGGGGSKLDAGYNMYLLSHSACAFSRLLDIFNTIYNKN